MNAFQSHQVTGFQEILIPMLCMKAENDNKKGFTLPYGE